ncbi:signal transduction histidine kinase [Saccharopolyspora lacisalsi]|uniref:histidine kinase n=1 Tax=Halosaccharopolyspora lacisalsi TaxID=1000566 RepID=A0A839E1W9_9PSEU|nr:nitrate- and nitrite sensing domain-containing protein [Halosaccharopolyspora lacisalsi]MBA8827070.1 signal transduction histidine kinase [Halosaccharopolyspora lacisalsi]
MIRQWRNWSIPVKLAAVMLVPVVFAITLGVVQIQEQVQRANRYQEVSTLLKARDKIQPLLTGLQRERTEAVQLLTGAGEPAEWAAKTKAVSLAASKAPQVLDEVAAFTPTAKARFGQLQEQLVKLGPLRKKVSSSSIEPVAAVGAYNAMVDSLLGLERSVMGDLNDGNLYGTVGALHELSSAEDEIRIQRALVSAGLARSDFGDSLLDTVSDSRARLAANLKEFKATADAAQSREFRSKVTGLLSERDRALDGIVRAAESSSETVSTTSAEWNELSRSAIGATTQLRSGLSQQAREYADGLYDESSDRAGLDAVLTFCVLLLAAAITFRIARNLLGSLRTLRRSALKAANKQLPEAVENIRHGGRGETEVASVPVETTDELGQLARAFDEVNRQALYLASEQAGLRRGYSDSFVNVSRRSQSLLERQLRLFEQLEQDEEDPEQLSTLFRLDHLATRMRRNNENLMVLSGSDLARRFSQPTPMTDVLRAAVSEIEHYPRVNVQPPPTVRLVGYAGSDLVRLFAELFDNAANFSAPTTSVTVSSYQAGDGSIVVDVLDQGIGMDPDELVAINERLASVDEPDLSTSRRMGVLVISRLATRHGIDVRLHGGGEGEGTRASLTIPPELVISPERAPQASQPAPGHGPGRNGKAKHDLPTSDGDGGTRRHVMEGGLPQQALGGGSDGATGTMPPANQPKGNQPPEPPAAPPQPPDARSAPPQSPQPRPQQSPSSEPQQSRAPRQPQAPPPLQPPQQPPASATPPPAEPPAPERRSKPRGLFEPPSDEERTNEPSSAEVPQQWGADAWTPPTSAPPASSPPSDLSVPEVPEPQPRAASPMFDANPTQWFQPTDEDASYQEVALQPGEEEHHWPTSEDLGAQQPRAEDSDGVGAWAFANEESSRSNGGPTKSEPAGYTASGLPRRTRGGQPVSGAGAEKQEDRTPGREQRAPEDVRGQLSSFQQGLQQSQSTAAPEPGGGGVHGTSDNGESAWNFVTDDAQHRAEAAANHKPSDYTTAGLPRRTPKAQLAPGSAAPEQQSKPSAPQSQPKPEDARGRLSSFQQGVRRGRHSAPDED